MKVAAMFRLTATLILIQIALGGLVTFNFLDPLAHIVWGAVVVAVAVWTGFTVMRMKPLDRQLRGVGIGVIAGLLVQILLGFGTLAMSSDALAWVHLVLGVLIYAMALTGMAFAQRLEHVPIGAQPVA